MTSDVAIRVRDVSKHYLMFNRPEDRLKQMVVPRLERLAGLAPTRYYRDFAALDGVSFDIRRGETVGIIGRNGCGKSTLLQIVCGTLQPTTGTVEINGRIAALLELGAGFNPEFTGRENVYLNAAILGLDRTEIDGRFEAIERFADIGEFIDQPVKAYSSGMYVRLAFAIAINVDPDILVVDEALAVGDEAFQRKCFARIEEIKDKGGTILFVSHSAQMIVQLCDRAILLDHGNKILDGRPKLVTGQYQRLVNASAEAAADIRAGILAMRDAEPKPAQLPVETTAAGSAPPTAPAPVAVLPDEDPGAPSSAPPPDDDCLADYFDASLRSQSTVMLEERGARLRDIRIATLDGKTINVLRMGKRYVVEYWADFATDARDVGFAMWIKTINGIGLGGAYTGKSRSLKIARVEAGQSICVTFEFTCMTLPGTYFINCAAYGVTDTDQIVLHRVIDALAWRTSAEADLLATGTIDFGALPRMRRTTGPRAPRAETGSA